MDEHQGLLRLQVIAVDSAEALQFVARAPVYAQWLHAALPFDNSIALLKAQAFVKNWDKSQNNPHYPRFKITTYDITILGFEYPQITPFPMISTILFMMFLFLIMILGGCVEVVGEFLYGTVVSLLDSLCGGCDLNFIYYEQ